MYADLPMRAAYRRPKRGRLCRPRCTCATQRGGTRGKPGFPREATLVGGLVPGLQLLAQVAQEAAGQGAVHETVVVRERQVHDRPDRDHVLAAVVLDHPGALDDRVGAEDRGLGLADHGRAVEGSVTAGVRDRERAALDVVRRKLLLAGAPGDVGDTA